MVSVRFKQQWQEPARFRVLLIYRHFLRQDVGFEQALSPGADGDAFGLGGRLDPVFQICGDLQQ
jgi:hypothetical protein